MASGETELEVFTTPKLKSVDQMFAYGDDLILRCRCDRAMHCANGTSTLRWLLEPINDPNKRLLVGERRDAPANEWLALRLSIDYAFQYGFYHCCADDVCDWNAVKILYRKCIMCLSYRAFSLGSIVTKI